MDVCRQMDKSCDSEIIFKNYLVHKIRYLHEHITQCKELSVILHWNIMCMLSYYLHNILSLFVAKLEKVHKFFLKTYQPPQFVIALGRICMNPLHSWICFRSWKRCQIGI